MDESNQDHEHLEKGLAFRAFAFAGVRTVGQRRVKLDPSFEDAMYLQQRISNVANSGGRQDGKDWFACG